ncbi:MAG: beta-ketoacyl-[acyl-carrier-protein] synthase family protein [Deltaproteobacteria bacterium]|nr:beta-ketoacyl-[acyl-carrier-protein] synthase family protein [Deltaproteobacteria bacterium]
MDKVRVAVTGLGAVCAAGQDVAGLKAALHTPSRVFGPSRRHALGFEVAVGEVRPEWFAQHDHPELDSPTGRLCLTAARECMAHACSRGASAPDGLAVGTSTGGQSVNEEMVFALIDGRPTPSPFGFRGRGCMASPSRLVARDLDVRGPVSTVSTACTSSANAIALGASWIREGRCKRVLAGGGDALCHTTISTFRILELTGPCMCTPFGPDRPGLTLGEGAGFLLLERLDDVLAASREPLAELLGFGMSSDAHHMTAPPADGAGAFLAMSRALDDARLSPANVHHVNAHGTGTRLNDAAEANAIARLLGANVPVSSCKGLVGHTLGGAGAIEAVASVLSVMSRRAFENAGAATAGDDCPIALVGPGGAALPERPVVLSNSFAFGGNNCALVLGPAPEARS